MFLSTIVIVNSKCNMFLADLTCNTSAECHSFIKLSSMNLRNWEFGMVKGSDSGVGTKKSGT